MTMKIQQAIEEISTIPPATLVDAILMSILKAEEYTGLNNEQIRTCSMVPLDTTFPLPTATQ